jgi:predicted transcriptional regulator
VRSARTHEQNNIDALRILAHMTVRRISRSAGEVGRALGLSPQAAASLLRTLEDAGHLTSVESWQTDGLRTRRVRQWHPK